MCGLVGIAGDISAAMASTTFKDLLDVCQVRGRDSTGVIRVEPNLREYDWVKQVGPPAMLYDTKSYERRIEKPAAALIGHTRSKTVGEISVKNAHPFDNYEEGICGVHNGTLQSYHNLIGYNYQKVDSEVLYNHLAAKGPEETFPILEGAFACVWWDQVQEKIFFIRNEDRPLYFAWSQDGRQLFWASEMWMFNVVTRKITLYKDENNEHVVELPPHQLWSYKINTKATKEEKVITFCQPKSLPPKSKPVGFQKPHWNTRGEWVRQPDGTYAEKNETSKVVDGVPVTIKTNPVKGGEVADPFLLGQREMDGIGLNDEIPDFLKAPIKKINSASCRLPSVISSNASTVPQTESKSSPTSNRKILSLPEKNFKQPPTATNVVNLADSKLLSQRRIQNTPSVLELVGVSHRNIAGIDYISSKRSGNEWASNLFLRTTQGLCTFCKVTYTDIREVGEILDAKRFICKSCISLPCDHKSIKAA